VRYFGVSRPALGWPFVFGGSARPRRSRAGMFSALRYRNFRLFWLGQLVPLKGKVD